MSARHHAPNDLIARGFASAGFPVSKEPTGVQIRREAPGRSHARPLAEWHGPLLGRHSYLFASRVSYVNGADREAVASAELAASRKEEKYADIEGGWLHLRANRDRRDFRCSQHVSPSAHVSAWLAGLLRSRGRLERPVSCFSVARCWCNVSTPSCCTIVSLSLTAQSDDHTRFVYSTF